MISESKMFDSAYCPCMLAIAAVKRSPFFRFLTGISSVVLLLLVLSPLAHAARDHGHYPSSLQVVLTPADEADHVSITATNMSDKPVTFLGWDTPFEADVLADVFDISIPEKGFLPVNRIKYAGPLPRRGLPDESAWITLEPGEELTRTINLPEYYPMAKASDVRISYNQDIVLQQRNSKKTRFPLESVRSIGAAQSASLELFVPQAEMEVQAASIQMKLSAAPPQARVLPANFNSCSVTQETAINNAFRASELATDTVNAELSALSTEELATSPRYQAWFGQFNAARDRTIANTLANTEAAFDEERMTFDCQCVLTNRNSLFGFIRRDQPFLVNVCPLFFSIPDEQVVTIVHELTHFNEIGPTDDFAYGPGPSQQLAATNPAAAARNADSYGYFVANNVPELPLTGSADGALVDNSSFEFEPLEIVSTRSGQVEEGSIDLFVVAGVTSINLESVTGDADLFVFADTGLTRLICSSESVELDSCQINTPRAIFIAVLGFTDSSYVLSTSGPSLDQPVTTLTPEESVTASVGRSGSDFYTVTGVQTIVLDSNSGDADLYVYSSPDFDFQSLVCESFQDSANTIRDFCRVPPDSTLYLRVFGFSDSEYTLMASQGTLDANGGGLGIASITSGETISALVAEGGVELYTVTGPGRIDLLSQSGDADLYVFADGQLDETVCESELFSADSTLDSCDIDSGNFVVAVLGFTASNFLLSMTSDQEPPVLIAEDTSNGIGGGGSGGGAALTIPLLAMLLLFRRKYSLYVSRTLH